MYPSTFHATFPHDPFRTFIKVYSTDDCCGDRDMVQEKLGPVAVEIAPSSSVSPAPICLQRLGFPAGKKPKVIQSKSILCPLAGHACVELRSEAERVVKELGIPGLCPAVGLDAEWEVWSAGAQPVATVQLATLLGTTYIFHVRYSNGRKIFFPKALRTLLEDDRLLKVGIPFALG